MALFSGASLTVLQNPQYTSRQPKCSACKLELGCKSPKMPVSGNGRKKILVIGESPGADEDAQGRQFVGKAGRRLRAELEGAGLDPDEDCWFTNAVSCRPPGNDLGPHPKAVEYCRPLVLNAVRDLNPRVVLVLGGTAVESLVRWLWREDAGGITRWQGYQIPSQRLRAWVCPTYHPSFVEREESPLVARLFRDHVRAAVTLKGRPTKREEPELELILDPDEAAEAIGQFGADVNRWVAFDFETNMLKPDGKDAEIVCASMSDGIGTIAFPWHGAAVKAAKRFLANPNINKVYSNGKFEYRWAMAKLGVAPAGRPWDTMVTAHVAENANKTRRVTSVKFQAFVKLGVEPWNTQVEPYLKSDGSNRPNRVREFAAEFGVEALLRYCALDSLYEWEVAMIQMKQMGGGHAD